MADIFDDIESLCDCWLQKCQEKEHLLEAKVQKLQGAVDCLNAEKSKKLKDEIDLLQESVRKLSADCEDLKRSEENLVRKTGEGEASLELQKKVLKEKLEQTEVKTRARYSVNMYKQISKVRWSQDPKPHGFINKNNTKTFKFDDEKQSQFFITNSLWSMSDSV